MSQDKKPHIAILGAGPTGLDAALAAAERGMTFTVYEQADTAAGHVDAWRHVQLFTPWSMSVSARMRAALDAIDRSPPSDDDRYPTGGELVDKVLAPVADLPVVRDQLVLGTRVLEVGRQGLLKHEEIGSDSRATHSFALLVEDRAGEQQVVFADQVLDCTGNARPNRLGDGGIAAPGEDRVALWIDHGIPSPEQIAALSGRHTLLLGGGHSAQTAVRGLAALVRNETDTRVTWVLRSPLPAAASVAGNDPLPERAALGAAAVAVASQPPQGVEVLTQAVVAGLAPSSEVGRIDAALRLADGSVTTRTVDKVLALIGSVGDHQLYRQLQVHECYATSGPMKLAAALMASSGGGGDCLAQASLGAETLRNPEPGFFILGIKSYGRRSDYLMRVGWEQVDEVFGLLEQ